MLHIAIVGGGIGGLSFTASLSHLNILNDQERIHVDLYESAQALTEIGAGITVWPRTWDILKRLGMESAMLEGKLALPEPAFKKDDGRSIAWSFRKADQHDGFHLFDLALEETSSFIHRPAILNGLIAATSPNVKVHLGHRLKEYKMLPDGKVQLLFTNGSVGTCDLLVGADGLKSVVRKHFFETAGTPAEIDLLWSGVYAHRSMIDSKTVQEKRPNHRVLSTPTIYCGLGKHIVAYPMPELQRINIIAYTTAAEEGAMYDGPSFTNISLEEMKAGKRRFRSSLRAYIIDETLQSIPSVTRWAIQSLNPLNSFGKDTVLLLGDAAHAMTPHHGSGAGQAIEDGFLLAHLIKKALSQPGGVPVASITKAYDTIRRPVANKVLTSSRDHGLLFRLMTPEFATTTNTQEETFRNFGKFVTDSWEYAWTPLTDQDIEAAAGALDNVTPKGKN